jgi:hypothetical protein
MNEANIRLYASLVPSRMLCAPSLTSLPDKQFARGGHAQIARRANMSHALALVLSGKSEAPFRTSCGL